MWWPIFKTHFLLFSFIDSRMCNSKVFVKYWLPVLVWMALIFSASSVSSSYQHSSHLLEPILHGLFPHLVPTRIDAIHYIFRKCGHLSEYAVLALLLWRAIGNTRRQPAETQRLQSVQGSWKWNDAGLAIFIVFLFAALDEFHQSFVPERTPLISDIFIDTCGGAAAILTLWLLRRRSWRKSR